jgi:UDP-2,3-diacylglucosamine pyrophosphatase LpxH
MSVSDVEKRKLPLVIISDVHLGTFGCQAKALHAYLKSIAPDMLVLNGDIIDIWQFRKSYFPKSHLKVLKRLFQMAAEGTRIVYVTGNHDEALRRFAPFKLDQIELVNKKILTLNGQNVWIFHGDIFDASVHHSKWIARLGGWGYDALIRLNTLINHGLTFMGKERYSLSGKIKSSVKKAVKWIGDFEQTAAELAIEQNYQVVICGHIHQPAQRIIETEQGKVLYLNAGDWVENCTALEFNEGQWQIYKHDFAPSTQMEEPEAMIDPKDLYYLLQNVMPSS